LVFVNPRPRQEFIEKWYPDTYEPYNVNPDDFYQRLTVSFLNSYYKENGSFLDLMKKIGGRFIYVFPPKSHLGRILDIGCGSGLYLHALKKHGWENSEKHIAALKKELEDVRCAKENNNYDFATYFLIVQDYVKAANEAGILVGPGRGSGYASVLLRCLDITWGIDPLGEGISMLWERFLAFDSIRFIKESDFGFSDEIESEKEIGNIDLEKNRELEEDLGGVDRY
jgi:DNA polymerase III alpha subunit